jgi:hypothetical protein
LNCKKIPDSNTPTGQKVALSIFILIKTETNDGQIHSTLTEFIEVKLAESHDLFVFIKFETNCSQPIQEQFGKGKNIQGK